MFKTLIYGLGALILGMLVYLYSEISQLRDSMAGCKPGSLVLHLDPVADASAPEGMKTLQATFSYPDRQVKIYRSGHYELNDKMVVLINPHWEEKLLPPAEEEPASPTPQQEGGAATPQEAAPAE